jgi:carbon monoxide dehydrogenase subunit G
MKISGTAQLSADPATVFNAFLSPEVLVRTLPGCQRLEVTGPDRYKMTVAAGVGSIKGVYDGQVELSDKAEPSSFRMKAQGAGAAGTIGADVLVSLSDADGGGTSLTYDADAVVGGMIGGVGQRMLTGVSKRMAAEFFANVDAVLAGSGDLAPAALPGEGVPANHPSLAGSVGGPVPSTAGTPSPVRPATGAAPGAVFTAPAAAASSGGPSFLVGVAAGAAVALAGVVVGALISRRRRG